MFHPAKTRSTGWTDKHQYLYSLLWSSFLDLGYYSAGRAYRRYRPYSTAWVLREILRDVPGIKDLGIGRTSSSFLDEGPALGLAPRFRDLALWAASPSLFQNHMSLGASGPYVDSERRRLDDGRLQRLREIFRRYFLHQFDVELAVFRQRFETWPLLPPTLGGQVTAAVMAARRSATAQVTADVQLPYEKLCSFVHPSTWNVCAYWENATDAVAGGRGVQALRLCLPGGRSVASKWRDTRVEFAATSGSFESRVDYDVQERTGPEDRHANAEEESELEGDEADEADGPVSLPLYSPERAQIAGLNGYLSFAKIAGRPGWTCINAQRTARFESPNHDRFRVETLLFWLAIDVLSFAGGEDAARPRAEVHAR